MLQTLLYCVAVDLKTHLGNDFVFPTKVLLKVLVLNIAILL